MLNDLGKLGAHLDQHLWGVHLLGHCIEIDDVGELVDPL
ncbi:hypothetical protein SDC9_205356 [bioreactor metagenome]|uniref:Uncharacterized protein n=1 Tax=bioreactor metagenome TaxID=1076179 RepID=A0A645J3I1_9ZZZZ